MYICIPTISIARYIYSSTTTYSRMAVRVSLFEVTETSICISGVADFQAPPYSDWGCYRQFRKERIRTIKCVCGPYTLSGSYEYRVQALANWPQFSGMFRPGSSQPEPAQTVPAIV